MAFKNKILMPGPKFSGYPKMGSSNYMYGIELKDFNKLTSKKSKGKKNGSKKRS
jgi:hypothetical protein